MGRWLDRVVVLGGLAALAACIQVAPRSSVPFQEARERQVRYAAEMTLAVKEERRDADNEAAVNGRTVLPQMPEVWGVARAQRQAFAPAAAPAGELGAPLPDVARAGSHDLLRPRCAGRPSECERPLQIVGLAPALRLDGSIAPAAAPVGADRATPLHRFQLYFDLDSTTLDAAAQRILEGVVGNALMIRPVRIIVAGHADRSGVDAYNQRLSQRRAAAVVGALVRSGIPAELIETTALGEQAPAVRTGDGTAHRHNRRVEIILI
jgi:outer membrane protein OmpA-like peptidoglycan-associated protein